MAFPRGIPGQVPTRTGFSAAGARQMIPTPRLSRALARRCLNDVFIRIKSVVEVVRAGSAIFIRRGVPESTGDSFLVSWVYKHSRNPTSFRFREGGVPPPPPGADLEVRPPEAISNLIG